MEPYNFLQNLNNKEIYNTLRMPIEQKPKKIKTQIDTPENINRNMKNNNNNEDIHFIKSTEFRLPLFLQDISFDNKNNR